MVGQGTSQRMNNMNIIILELDCILKHAQLWTMTIGKIPSDTNKLNMGTTNTSVMKMNSKFVWNCKRAKTQKWKPERCKGNPEQGASNKSTICKWIYEQYLKTCPLRKDNMKNNAGKLTSGQFSTGKGTSGKDTFETKHLQRHILKRKRC